MNKQNSPLVSVIIATYKNEELLPRAIESVLHQTYPAVELIVVDDNAPDSDSRKATEAVMRQYPSVCYLRHHENRNGAAARNTGIQAAHGEYIAFLDNDDVYFSSHIAGCVEALRARTDCSCVLCSVLKIRSGLCWDIIPAASGDLKKKLFLSETLLGTGSNLFVSAKAVKDTGGFDESFLRHQDVEFGIRLFSKYQACSLDDIQIIKEMEGFSNVPDFKRFLDTKQHLWLKFQSEIHAMSEEERTCYYAGQYSSLLYTACKAGSHEEILWTEKQLQQYRSLNMKERLLILLSLLKLFPVYEKVKLAVKKRNSDQLYRRVVCGLGEEDRRILDFVLKKTHS